MDHGPAAVVPTSRLARAVAAAAPQLIGSVSSIIGLSVEVCGLPGAVGDLIAIEGGDDGMTVAEVVAVTPRSLRCMPLGPVHGLRVGMAARATGSPLTVPAGPQLLGRVLDGLGRPMDGKGPLGGEGMTRVPVSATAPDALARARVDTPVGLGVTALDTLVTVGRGQRIGLFAGSGVGKSSLLSMVARGTDAEVSVIALIGERGREVREFLEDDLGPEGLARSVVVVATSDQPAMVRLRAAFVATRIAEDLRSRGSHAVLMMDSLTRVAMAQREIGLSVGEPPATRGYPPSTFSMLAQLLERAGTDEHGSVTGIYTVLVDGDDHNEPIADAARSILDGHVVLTRDLAVAGHYPAIDVLGSISRVATRVTTPEQRGLALKLRKVLAARRRAQDLLDVGAYAPGSNALVDAAVANSAAIDGFLQQSVDQAIPAEQSWSALAALVTRMGVQ
ncbi:FliI/YscN family ATPase [Demequina capsici]|uniref:FliI/YscN family ATPase n=1 Tax=Demequina capsici TaxID=3075620 RepID=A0AA96FF63_9MICO|nr:MULTISPECIES: FliI/YscN family ATPase [unclassified Demequina]WNM26004.1 FliI/YscN family ATPase [Demequina sp. OYTSA14]WNM28878.1 FliI/YscN family ATPase [Demequina sp. PMTSA13]